MAQSWLTLFRICTELHRVGSVWPELAQSGTDDSDWPELAPSGTKCAQNGKNWPLLGAINEMFEFYRYPSQILIPQCLMSEGF